MFFIGISAHLFMYLLFPMLIVIWFYFKGIAGKSEDHFLFSEPIECTYSIQTHTEVDYFYSTPKKEKHSTWIWYEATSSLKQEIRYVSPIYIYFLIKNSFLRAPPETI